MDTEAFSNEFDTLLNSNFLVANMGESADNTGSVSLDEYEKSVFLTKAQEEIVTSYYNGNNASGESFESTEEMRRYLANLVKEKSLTPISNSSGLLLGIGTTSKFFTLPENLWFITYENVSIDDAKCSAYNPMDVYPVTQDDYQRTKRNPFRGPNDRRALRLDLADGVVEIVCKYNVTSYYVRYIKKLKPIIVTDLPDDLEINGVSQRTECELHEALHRKILELAVREALTSKLTTKSTK